MGKLQAIDGRALIVTTLKNEIILLVNEDEQIPFGISSDVVAYFFCLAQGIRLFDKKNEPYTRVINLAFSDYLGEVKFTSIYSFKFKQDRAQPFTFTKVKESDVVLGPKFAQHKASDEELVYEELKKGLKKNKKFREFLVEEGKRKLGA